MSGENAKTPVYQQLLGTLRVLVKEEDFLEGDRFLTERQVSERFGVSRPTANKALASLVAEGMLEFRKGVGTFVRGKVLDYDLGALTSFTRKAEAAGKRPTTQVLAFETITAAAAPGEVANQLECSPESPLHYMERLRLADGAPVILEHRWVSATLCPGLERKELHGSLYQVWTERFLLGIGEADQRIRALNLSGTEARLLSVRPGLAALEVLCRGFLRTGEPLWYERTIYRGDAYEFHQLRAPNGRLAPGSMTGRLV
jgi:GntR family transcriptional regulator